MYDCSAAIAFANCRLTTASTTMPGIAACSDAPRAEHHRVAHAEHALTVWPVAAPWVRGGRRGDRRGVADRRPAPSSSAWSTCSSSTFSVSLSCVERFLAAAASGSSFSSAVLVRDAVDLRVLGLARWRGRCRGRWRGARSSPATATPRVASRRRPAPRRGPELLHVALDRTGSDRHLDVLVGERGDRRASGRAGSRTTASRVG